jgi:hypothetical protein
VLQGYGIENWPDGTYYQGQITSGKKQGIGTYKWIDGSIYTGEWNENLMTGHVIYIK